jgi:hypothetical protein
MILRTTPLLTTLLFALSIGLSPLIFAANPAWDSNYVYNKKVWDATSTAGLKKGIRQSKAHKRSRKSKGSMRFALIPNKCIRNPEKDGLADDCDRGIRRSQLRSHASYKRNKNLEFRFSLKKPYRKSKGLTKITYWIDKYFMLIYQIKPKDAAPIIHIKLDPVTNKILFRLGLANHDVAGVDPIDINTVIGKLKSGWNDFRVKTKLSMNKKGYVKVYQNNKLIYSYKGKTTYPYKNDYRHWLGPYVCCGFGDLLHKKEPTHLFFYDMVKVRVLK